MTDALTAAGEYAELKWRTFPLTQNAKTPAVNDWPNIATTNPNNHNIWFNGPNGIGIATGQGLLVVDIDTNNGKTGHESLADLEETYEPLPTTREAITASGGRHLYYTYPAELNLRNTASKLGKDIDTRADGGYVVAPPTALNGNTYEWELSSPIQPAPAPQWLLKLLTEINAPACRPRQEHTPHTGPARPGDLFAAKHTWAELLTADGATFAGTRTRQGQPYELWVRPGKTIAQGTSATLYYGGTDCLKVFTSGWPGLEDGGLYTLFGYYTATRYNGNFAEATRTLSALGYTITEDDWTTGTTPTSAEQLPDAEESADHGWMPVNLASVLEDGYTPPVPTILTRTDGHALFYRERINALYGESGSGKSWVALTAAAQQLVTGANVVYFDLEDHPGSVTARLMALGVTKTQITVGLDYVNPNGSWNELAAQHWEQHIAHNNTALVVIDSTGEAMASDGTKPNDDDDVARWFRRFARRLARAGAAVLLLDHIPKSTDANNRFAIGSQRKLAAIDGAAYRVEVGVAPARGTEGHIKLITTKDRAGNYQHGARVAEIEIADIPTGTTVTIRPPGDGLPTVIMARICDYLEQFPDENSAHKIETNVAGKAAGVRFALSKLIDLKYVERTVRTGGGGGFEHRLVRKFEESDLWTTPKTTTSSPLVPPSSPEKGRTSQNNLVPLVPPLITGGTRGRGWDDEDTPQTPTTSSPAEWDLY